MTEIIEIRQCLGDATMWVALEVNIALWGMITCLPQIIQQFLG
jgi:hypothetical protein